MQRYPVALKTARVFCAGICTLLVACQGTGGVVESLDGQTGLTVVTDAEAAVFARTRPQISRSARDYLYLGPVEVNEHGVREYFLWLALASTIDDAFTGARFTEPGQLIVEVEGEPMEFELQPWDRRLPRLAGRRLYDSVVAPESVLAARVTLDQITRLAGSEISSVRITFDRATSAEYWRWQENKVGWSEFSRYAGNR